MTRVFGTVGAGGILLLLLAITALLAIDHDIQRTIDRVEEFVSAIGTAVRERLAAWRESSREAREIRRTEREAERQAAESQSSVSQPVARPAAPAPAVASNGPRSTINDQFRPGSTVQSAVTPPRPAAIEPPPAPRPAVPPPAREASVSTERSGPVEIHVQEQVQAERADPGHQRRPEVPAATQPYQFPPLSLLQETDHSRPRVDYDEIQENNQILLDKLATYNIEITNINAIVGPTVTLYELTPAPGVKISRITALENDLAMAMAARGIRMIAPIPGKSAVGVEIPNRHRELVRVRDIISTARFQNSKMDLPVAIGKAIDGEVFVEDLTRMPHLLIAGATGSGKSVGLNTLIVGLLYACHPRDLKFVMIDPKKIELQQYSHILDHYVAMPPHSEDPIITDFAEALGVLKSCEKEMEQRYDLLADAGVRSIRDYNKRVDSGKLDAESGHRHLPYIVVIVDELADLMMTAGKDIEGPIARLAQMARAVGIHLVLATQRPSVDVITGLIKANFPSRIAYQVASKVDSRTILDQNGAEGLVGNGDLLYMSGSHVIRLQGPFVSVEEVDEVTRFIGDQDGPGPYVLPSIEESASTDRQTDVLEETDEFFDEAARIIVRSQQGSVSLLQRKLSVGYTRAARIVDQLEDAGVVGPFEGSKARRVLIENEAQLDAFLEARK
ncbi:MAG TPA: DNA translocase FtsK, partial [Rhodothermales bacterium]